MKTELLTIVTKAINNFLQLDPESNRRIGKLQNKIISMELLFTTLKFSPLKNSVSLKIILNINDGKIIATDQTSNDPDVCIKGTPISLLHLSLAKNKRKFFENDVSITGDLELGQQIIDLFDEMEIDWEEFTSKLIGDIPAHQVGRLVSGFKNMFKTTKSSLIDNISEYIHEEILIFPPKEALKDFYNEIDNLRMDTDRIQARISALKVYYKLSSNKKNE